MSIEKQFYLSCNNCHGIHPSRSDDAQDLEDEALDDGWVISEERGKDINNDILSLHHCPNCVKKMSGK